MNPLQDLLRQMTSLLAVRRQPWALVGGLAVSIRTEPRFTRDIDLAVAVCDDPAAESLVFELQAKGFRTLATVEQQETRRLATARMAPAGGQDTGLMVDLLFASSGIEAEVCAAAEPLAVFPGITVPVARIHHLIALKVLARDDRTRPQDAADLRLLIAAARTPDLDASLEAMRLIEARGFHRGRNLVQAFRTVLGEYPAQIGSSHA